MEFWERLNALIKKRKVTQEWVAERAGVKYQTFRNWSARHIIPDAIQASRIAKVLETDVEYLSTGEPSRVEERIPCDLQEVINKYAEK